MNPEDSTRALSTVEVETRIVKEFLDIIILCELKEHGELSGYDIALKQKQKFGINLSPGTIYSTLYAVERRGLISPRIDGKKTTYVMTAAGEKALNSLRLCSLELVDFIKCVFPISIEPPKE